ncbi:MAG: hypothetical protein LBR60_01380 [Fibrobacter sp.]|jgi:hypothetical protein|nr:hypothetical protein [Fibrobacter sp.]
MEATHLYQKGVEEVVRRVHSMDSEIGSYKDHTYDPSANGFIVELSNGFLKMSREVARDCEEAPDSVTRERVRKVAETFKPKD